MTNEHKPIRTYAENALNAISETNQPTARRYVSLRRLQRLKEPTLYNYALSLRHLDAFLQGKPYRDATADDMLDFLTDLSGTTKAGTRVMYTRLLRRFFLDQNDGELPPGYAAVLTCRDPEAPDNANLIQPDDLRALLAACKRLRRSRAFNKVLHDQALLLTLYDSGFRIAELLSLKQRNVIFDGDKVTLRLEANHPGLKSGPREVRLLQCGGALKAWLGAHPSPAQDRYVFLSTQGIEATRPLRNNTVNDMLLQLAKLTDMFQNTAKSLTCHDFRHSSATRRSQWGEAKLRLFHGWSRTSNMPMRYVHHDLDELEATLRRDAGVDDLSISTRHDNGMKTCPTCAEDIKAAALKCRYCGEMLKPLLDH